MFDNFFTDYWALICVLIFFITGIIFVKTKKVHFSPIFLIPLGYSIFEIENNNALITEMTKEDIRRFLEDNPDGIEARELERGIYWIK